MKTTSNLFTVNGLFHFVSVTGEFVLKFFTLKSSSILMLLVGSLFFQSAFASELVKSVRLQVASGNYVDELYVGFFTNAKDGYDAYDSEKMDNGPSYPEIWTYADGVKLVINGLSTYTGSKQVAVGFQAGQTGSFSIKATEILNFDPGTSVVLTDNETGISQNLALNPVYYFTSNLNTSDRFKLTITTQSATNVDTTTTTVSSSTSTTSTVDTTKLNVSSSTTTTSTTDTNATVTSTTSTVDAASTGTSSGSTSSATGSSDTNSIFTAMPTGSGSILVTLNDLTFIGSGVTLYTMYGKRITSTALKDLTTYIGSNLKQGIYIVEVKSKKNCWTQKVSIR
ncbi:MAG: T9SS type A sorting domain-containing protein [Bacteroidota bacterium]|nr:T9SS type A sorting domain-containing protein [Bacteroidota bacterium]